jgi:hypothetical protein
MQAILVHTVTYEPTNCLLHGPSSLSTVVVRTMLEFCAGGGGAALHLLQSSIAYHRRRIGATSAMAYQPIFISIHNIISLY